MATTLLDRLFTPHGPEAYLRWVPTVGRGRTENPDPTERKNEAGQAKSHSDSLSDQARNGDFLIEAGNQFRFAELVVNRFRATSGQPKGESDNQRNQGQKPEHLGISEVQA